jgi:hypothetical protein
MLLQWDTVHERNNAVRQDCILQQVLSSILQLKWDFVTLRSSKR